MSCDHYISTKHANVSRNDWSNNLKSQGYFKLIFHVRLRIPALNKLFISSHIQQNKWITSCLCCSSWPWTRSCFSGTRICLWVPRNTSSPRSTCIWTSFKSSYTFWGSWEEAVVKSAALEEETHAVTDEASHLLLCFTLAFLFPLSYAEMTTMKAFVRPET